MRDYARVWRKRGTDFRKLEKHEQRGGKRQMFKETEISYQGAVNDKTGMYLGGLGTGCVSIDRAGRFQDMRLQNNWEGELVHKAPHYPVGSFFSVYAESAKGAVGRVLQMEQEGNLPRVEGLTYRGDFPFLNIDYRDAALPVEVGLEAFSPMIPHDAEASSLPAIFFTFLVRNPGQDRVRAKVGFSWQNDISIYVNLFGRASRVAQGRYNMLSEQPFKGASMLSHEPLLRGSEYRLSCLPGDDVDYACVADWWNIRPLRCAGPDFDNADGETFKFAADHAGALDLWRCFLEKGELPPERSHDDHLGAYSYHAPAGAVSGAVDLEPGEEKRVRFALSWRFPYHTDGSGHDVGNYYAERFADAGEVVAFAGPRADELRERCVGWKRILAGASLPDKALKHLSGVLYLLTRITWRIKDGTLIYYEAIKCTRMFAVLLDQYAAPVMAAFFPDLHATTLRYYTRYQLDNGEVPTTLGQAGSMSTPEFRVFSPNDVPAFALSVYNNLMWGGDRDFAREMYPKVKAAMQWGFTLDVDGDGVPDCHGIDQGWDTWPMHGAVCYISDLWIHALEAVERLAGMFEDEAFRKRCEAVREQAIRTVEEVLWNGEFYNISHNPVDNSVCETSFMDQFAGHSWGWPLGLGASKRPERIQEAVKHIFRNNVELTDHLPLSGAERGGKPSVTESGKSKQSRAFVPCTVGSFAANAMRYGETARALKLFEDTSSFVIDEKQEPWLALLLFDAADGEVTYGFHYVDLLMIWDVMHAVTGHRVDSLAGTITLDPPRVPCRGPLFTRLLLGDVEIDDRRVTLRNIADREAEIRRLTVCTQGREQVFRDVAVPAHGETSLALGVGPESGCDEMNGAGRTSA